MGKFEERAQNPNHVEHFIQLVRVLEIYALDAGWTAEDVANACRITRYEKDPWHDLVKRDRGFPRIGELSPPQNLEARITAMIGHGPMSGSAEAGVSLDLFGNRVATGHMLTGVVAGMRHDLAAHFIPFNAPQTPGDNVQLATLTGDLGQTVGEVGEVGADQAVYDKPGFLTGVGHGATTAELIGDFDGILLGMGFGWSPENSRLRQAMIGTPMNQGGPRFSDFLLGYYWPSTPQSRWTMMYGGSPIRVDWRWHNTVKYLNANINKLFTESLNVSTPYSFYMKKHLLSDDDARVLMDKAFHNLIVWLNEQIERRADQEHL